MIENNIPNYILKNLQYICQLHEHAVLEDYKCKEFSEILSELLVKLGDVKFYQTADILMSILINCKPTEASHCGKTTIIESMIREVAKDVQKKIKLKVFQNMNPTSCRLNIRITSNFC